MAEKKALQQACRVLTDALRERNASEHQIEAMTNAFYIGASQTYMLIDAATETDAETFHSIMEKLFDEIDTKLKEIEKLPRHHKGDNR